MSSVTSSDVTGDACNLYCTHEIRLKSVLFSSDSHMHYKMTVCVSTENRPWFLEKKLSALAISSVKFWFAFSKHEQQHSYARSDTLGMVIVAGCSLYHKSAYWV